MKNKLYYKLYSVFIVGLYFSCCLCFGFFIDLLFNLARHQLELTLTFRLMISGKLDLPFTFLAFVFNSILLILVFVNHAKIMLLDMNSRVVPPSENHLDAQAALSHAIYSICEKINLKNCPTIHLADVEFPNLFAFGLGRHQHLVITTRLIKLLNESELRAVLTYQLLIIKFELSTMKTTVVLISNLMLIVYDFLFFDAVYNASDTSTLFKKICRVLRFFIPAGLLWFKYFLDPDTNKRIDYLTIVESSQSALFNSLVKIEQYHHDNHELMAKCYTKIRNNEVRRELFLFDSAEYNYAQTIGLPFTSHLLIQHRINQIKVE